MKKPPAMVDVVLAKECEGVHTFSNGTDWDLWAEQNCFTCRWYDLEGVVGEFCAFEGAALLHMVTPELAALFGWQQTTPEYGLRFAWKAPRTCAFWTDKTDDNGEMVDPRVPSICTETLPLFDDAALLKGVAA